LLGVVFLARKVKCWRPLIAVDYVYLGEDYVTYFGWCRPHVLDVAYLTNRLEREEEQGIRGELKCVHFCLFIVWPLDRNKRIKKH
jgi:hypothetical protein